MKLTNLYFYILEGDRITFSECEAEEKQKSYILAGKLPGFYGNRILKSELGLLHDYNWKTVVVLSERDDELAKEYLSDYINGEIDKKNEEISELMGKLEIVKTWKYNEATISSAIKK